MQKILLINILLFNSLLPCKEVESDLSIESFLVHTKDLLHDTPMEFGFLRTRFQFLWEPELEREFHLELHQESIIGKEFLKTIEFQSLRASQKDLPFEVELASSLESSAFHNLRVFRAFYQNSGLDQTFTVGLQRIALGVGRIWNPLDLLHPRDPGSLQPTLQNPVMALHWENYPSALSKFQSFSTFGTNWKSTIQGIHYQWFEHGWDQGITLLRTSNSRVLGFQVEGNLGNTGLEARFEGGIFEESILNQREFQAVAGVDYGFPNAASIALEFFFNQVGSHNLPQNTTSLSLGRQLPYQGEQYLGILGTYPLTPIQNLSGVLISNLSDGSHLFSLGWSHRRDEFSEWGIGFQLARGSNGSEFGLRTDTLYLQFNRFF